MNLEQKIDCPKCGPGVTMRPGLVLDDGYDEHGLYIAPKVPMSGVVTPSPCLKCEYCGYSMVERDVHRLQAAKARWNNAHMTAVRFENEYLDLQDEITGKS